MVPHPSERIACIRFNFLLRRTLIELMHADLIAIRTGLAQLEASGIRFLNCERAGLSANESVSRVKHAAEEWKQPFQKEYTERTVSQAFEKLLGLRSDVERALEKVAGKASENTSVLGTSGSLRGAFPAKNAADEIAPSAKEARGNEKAAPEAG